MTNDKNRTEPAVSPTQKKKYRRPEILYREPLEAMAALCTPRPPAKANVGTCPLAQRS